VRRTPAPVAARAGAVRAAQDPNRYAVSIPGTPGTARRASYLFAALSHACHYHPYELAPTAAELTGWLDQAAQIVTQLQTATAPPATQT
jgi:hypothetical protein